MIKINSLLFRTFSTIKFPQKYIIKHQLNNQFRSCCSLKQINIFVSKHHTLIQQYAKTQILQYLNEFTLGYDANQQLQGFAFVLNLKDLNMYEEQLRYKILFKIRQYTKSQVWNQTNIIKWGEEHMLQKIKTNPFDLVDSINFLVMRAFKKNNLIQYSLQMLNKIPVQNYRSMFSKCTSMILKRMDELEWISTRKYRQIFEYICYKNFITYEDEKQLIEISERLASLKLHKLGYDMTPISLDHNFQALLPKVDTLEQSAAQSLFRIFQILPLNYNPSVYQILLQKILKFSQSNIIYLQLLPLNRMTAQQINKITIIYANKWLQVQSAIYCVNRQDIAPMIFNQVFLKKMQDLLLKPVKKHRNIKKVDFIGYLIIFIRLWNYYRFDNEKKQNLKKQFLQIYQIYKNQYGLQSLCTSYTLCNLIHLIFINETIFANNPDIELKETIFKQIEKFFKKKNSAAWKTVANYGQLYQVMDYYINTSIDSIKTLVYKIVYLDISNRNNTDLNYAIPIACSIENSKNQHYFANIIHKIYSHFSANDCLALADYYIICKHKTLKSTIKMIQRIWLKGRNFIPIGKILAHTEWIFIQTEEGKLPSQIQNVLVVSFQYLKKQDIQQYSFQQIYNILLFGSHHLNSMKAFMQIFTQFVVQSVNNSQKLQLKNINILKRQTFIQILLKLVDALNLQSEETLKLLKQLVISVQVDNNNQIFLSNLFKIGISNTKSLLTQISCQNEKNQVSQRFNNKIYRITDEKTQPLYILKLLLEQKLSIKKQGVEHLKNILKQQLLNQQIFPLNIKQTIQIVDKIKSVTNLQQNIAIDQMIRQLLVFSLRQIKTQQGMQFYYWCLKMAKKYIWPDLVEATLDLLTLFNCDQALLNKIFAILVYFPTITNKNINRQIVILMNSINYNVKECYLSLTYYLSITSLDNNFSNKQSIIKKLPSIELELQKQWLAHQQKMKKNKNIDWNSTIIKTYKYLFLALKNQKISQKTLTIFYHCNKYKHFFNKILQTDTIDNINMQIFKLVNKYYQNTSQQIKNKPVIPSNSTELVKATKRLFKNSKNINPIEEFILFQKQLQRLNIPQKCNFEQQGNFYCPKFSFKGLDVQHFLRFKGKNYIIFFKNQNSDNKSYVLQKMRLFQHLYPLLQNLEILYSGENQFLNFLQKQNKNK